SRSAAGAAAAASDTARDGARRLCTVGAAIGAKRGARDRRAEAGIAARGVARGGGQHLAVGCSAADAAHHAREPALGVEAMERAMLVAEGADRTHALGVARAQRAQQALLRGREGAAIAGE